MKPSNWKRTKEALATAMELQGGERDKFIAALPEEIRADVQRLLAADEHAQGFISEPALVERGFLANEPDTDIYDGEVIDSYRLIRKIGSGGMGTVYLAEHSGEDFSQKVAIKLIKRGMDSKAVLKRFLMERQILANLEHPNIARMLDGGSTAEGLPYFVMEYVDGVEIRDYSNAQEIGLSGRLELFRKICDAVASAHQKLVVHRDLKPSNILVTKDGEPKLLDFGIAKLISPDWSTDTNEATLTQFRILTPEYASPEQLAGGATATSTDIYTLGVVLYELLTGERPHKTRGKTPKEIADSILSYEPPKPSTAWLELGSSAMDATGRKDAEPTDPRRHGTRETAKIIEPAKLQGDLDNIILKAIRREPERRYQSVQEFSEDIRRYLNGLPVTATADSALYRFNKYFKRHRIGVIGTAVAAVLLLAATAVTSWQYVVANRERERSEQRFRQVRDLARKVIFDYSDGIVKLAGSTEIREKMVADALEYLDNLSSEKGNDPSLKREIANGYQRVGDIRGNPFRSSNLGDIAGALESYLKALAIWQDLYDADPGEPQNILGLRSAELAKGEALWGLGRHSEAKTTLDRALELTLFIDSQGIEQNRNVVMDVYNRTGQVREQLWDLEGALEVQERVLAMTENDLAQASDDLTKLNAHASSYARMGDINFRKGLFKEAGSWYEKGIPIFEKVADSDVFDTKRQSNLALIYARRAVAGTESGDFEKGLEFNSRSLEIMKRLSSSDPKNLQTKIDIATITGNLGANYCRVKKTELGIATFRESIAIFDTVFNISSDYDYARGNAGITHLAFADELFDMGRAAEALNHYQKALEFLASQSEDGADDEGLATVYYGLGRSVLQTANTPEGRVSAFGYFQKAAIHLEKLETAGRLNAEYSAIYESVKAKLAE